VKILTMTMAFMKHVSLALNPALIVRPQHFVCHAHSINSLPIAFAKGILQFNLIGAFLVMLHFQILDLMTL